MLTKQVSVFLENKKGRLAEVTRLLADAGINIRALSLADMVSHGILRLIVNDSARCLQALKEHDLVAQETDVMAVKIEDKPGGLFRVTDVLNRAGVNIEYMYAFFEKHGSDAIVVFKVDDAPQAVEALNRNEISLLPGSVIQNL